MRDWWHWGLGFVAGAALSAYLTLSCAPTRAQTEEVADAIEYGISLGLPPAWAWRVAWCESRYASGAYNRASGASGVFQFIPSTWRATPQGRAGMSPFDPYANAAAAAWLYSRAGAPGMELPVTRVPLTPSGPRPAQCCELGWSDKSHPAPAGSRLYVGAFGFRYHLCDDHYRTLVLGLLRCEGNRRQTRPMGRTWSERGALPKRRRG